MNYIQSMMLQDCLAWVCAAVLIAAGALMIYFAIHKPKG
jgi:hypothetical protein